MKLGKKSRSSDFCGFLDCRTSLTGELEFSGTLRIDGNLHGAIKTSDTLIVGENATIEAADISAGEVQIFGTVLGNIDCDGRVEICDGGHLRGEVRTPRFIIEEGGKFEGLSRPATDSTPNQSLPEPERLGAEDESEPALSQSALPHTAPWDH